MSRKNLALLLSLSGVVLFFLSGLLALLTGWRVLIPLLGWLLVALTLRRFLERFPSQCTCLREVKS